MQLTDSFDLRFLNNLYGLANGSSPGRKPSDNAAFRWVWRKRFEHLHSDVIEIALVAELARKKRGEPAYWRGS